MKVNADKCHFLIAINEERNIYTGRQKTVKIKSCLRSPLILNCLLLSMSIISVIKLVKSFTHWLDYLVL